MRAVVGYEEKDPEITRHLTSGYPRFVIHPFCRQLAAHVATELGLGGHTLWLTVSLRAAEDLAAHLGAAQATRINHSGLHGVAHPEDPALSIRAKTYLQHTGGFLSSREAEDRLARLGLVPGVTSETLDTGDALSAVRTVLRKAYPTARDADFILTNTGMSAFHAAWRALSDLQAARGRTVWIQLGWLYLDTIAIVRKFAPTPQDYVYLPDVHNLAALEQVFAERGDRIAGIITEAPTNPLIETSDLATMAALAHRHGARVVLDPTLVSPFNVEVLPHADIVVNSLTKYAASEGDVIAGVIVINPAGPDADHLRTHCTLRAESIYRRDLARLAAQIGDYESVIAKTNATTPKVVSFLENHPRVSEVFWSLHPASRDNYLRIARSPSHVGAMVTFTLRMPLDRFYDRLRIPKGPSFGMKTSLICPFIYLAHYDLVTSVSGRAELAASGLNPELLRLSIGCESPDDIIAALAEALS